MPEECKEDIQERQAGGSCPRNDSGTVPWTVLCTPLLTDQQKAVCFVDGSSKGNGQHLVGEAAGLRPADGKTD